MAVYCQLLTWEIRWICFRLNSFRELYSLQRSHLASLVYYLNHPYRL